MDDYAGRVLADRYRLPLPPSDEYEFTEFSESRAFDTYSGQEVLVRQVPLPEVLEAEVLDADGLPDGFVARDAGAGRPSARTTRRPADPVVRRAIEAAQAAAQIPDHPRLDQVFDVFAEGGSLWIVSELVAARSLDVLLAEKPLSPYRAAEVAADVLTALRVLHAHGWVHRNITARTVLVCDDGRVMLTGLAVGAAEEALCGYDPVPDPAGTMPPPMGSGPGPHSAPDGPGPGGDRSGAGRTGSGSGGDPAGFGMSGSGSGGAPSGPGPGSGGGRAGLGPGTGVPGGRVPLGGGTASGSGSLPALGRSGSPGGAGPRGVESGRPASGGAGPSGPGAAYGVVTSGLQGADAEAARRAAIEARAMDTAAAPDASETATSAAGRAPEASEDIRAARAGAIAAYRAGARAAARVQGEQHGAPPAMPGPRPAEARGETQALPQLPSQQRPEPHTGNDNGAAPPAGPTSPQHGRITDPYGVSAPKPWHGALPRTGTHTGTGPAGQDDARTADNGSAPSPYTQPHTRPTPTPYPQPNTPPTPTPYTPPTPKPYEQPAPAPAPAPMPAPAPPAPYANRIQPTHSGAAPAPTHPRRGPATALAAERARQARMAVVGPVTERWAPEQAGPVHENWQLAAPIGPATDLWALGALLFRAVQGHAPYPEESTAELVELVVSEPPAYAEECGPLRPVVESLLRQDPTERLDFEELRGWLRSLVRSAPEPNAGADVVVAPPMDPRRLPIVRRRGELVRKRRAGLPATSGRHKRARDDAKPRRLGRNLVLLILLAMAAAIAYAMYFLPKAGQTGNGQSGNGQNTTEDTGAAGAVSPAPSQSVRQPESRPSTSPEERPSKDTGTQTDGAGLPQGFRLREDPEGFELAVATGWDRQPKNARGQVIYYQGNFELIVVPGRDSTKDFSGDPMTYQRESEPELQPFRDSTWATSSGMRRVEVGGKTMAEGQFTWTDGEGKELYVRNLAILDGGRYHVVQLRGPESERDQVTRLYEQASATYRTTG